jgi:hypothetical protein
MATSPPKFSSAGLQGAQIRGDQKVSAVLSIRSSLDSLQLERVNGSTPKSTGKVERAGSRSK